MKNSYKAALLVALGLSGASAVQAQNELYLGFTGAPANNTAGSDIVIDLGQSSTLVGQTSVVNLSGDLTSTEISAFNSVFTTPGITPYMSVIGANNVTGSGDAFGTRLRSAAANAAGIDANAGSSLSIKASSTSLVGAANALASDSDLPSPAGSFVQDTSKNYSTQIGTGSGSFSSKSGFGQTVAAAVGNSTDGSGIVIEDLWETTPYVNSSTPNNFYEGFFTFNDTVPGAPTLTFTSADVTSVPEPTTYGLIAGAGLLVVSLRNQFRRKNA
jgi:hypothetical protein